MGDSMASSGPHGAGGATVGRGLLIAGLGLGLAVAWPGESVRGQGGQAGAATEEAAQPAGAQREEEGRTRPDKSGYTLFNPTPRDQMRPIVGDRPDLTEAPTTVDAGHLQIETGFINYSDNPEDGVERRWAVLNDTNLRLGVLNDTEVQAIFTPYAEQTDRLGGGATETVTGFGDVTLRVKQNLWGNDEGDTAFAVMPAIKIPTGTDFSNDKVEGSVIGTFGWDVAENWGLGFQIQPGAAYDAADDDYDFELGHTAVLGVELVGPLGGYVEYGGNVSSESASAYEAVFSTGLTYGVNANTVLDVGTRLGLTGEAENATVFSGITVRF